MRIVLLNRFFFPDHSATSQLVTDLAEFLSCAGHEVIAITSRQLYDAPAARLHEVETHRAISIRRVWTTRFGRGGLPGRALDYLSFYLSATVELCRQVRSGCIVVAMTDPPLLSVPAIAVARVKGALFFNWLQDIFPEVAEQLELLRPRSLGPVLRALRDWTVRHADVNVVIGEPMAARFRHSSRTQPVVIPNWALEERAEEGAITPDTRPGHGLRTDWGLDGKLVVGYSGNMGRAHRLHELIDAAADMHDETEVRFLLIGDGAQRNSLIARTRALGLENVIFRPYQARESLRESLSVPDVHIVSLDGRLEGLIVPSKFVGVLAMGRPVLWIGAPDGEIGTLVRSSGCGISVAPGDVSGLISQLRELVADYKCGGERIKRMSSRAHMLWQERFTRRNALQMWSSMIASCGRRNE